MSSLYSGEHGEGRSARASNKSIGQAMQRTREWMAAYQTGSGDLTASTSSHSPFSNPNDDLDLDSLFRRLDRYTAEMQEVEDRLKRARSISDKSEGIHIKRFSFEGSPSLEAAEPLPTFGVPPKSYPLTDWKSGQITSITTSSEQASPAPLAHTQPQNSMHTKYPSLDQDELQDDSPAPLSGNWKQWAEQRFLPTKLALKRSSSRYSDRRESYSEPLYQEFVWKRQSPSPPVNGSHHASGSEVNQVLAQMPEYSIEDHDDYQQYDFSEEDEPGPAIPRSWTLPPRTSSMKQPHKEVWQEEATTSSRPMPRRRMTTSDARPSIRNGGLWSGQAAELFAQDDEPPVPSLSQSTSIATLSSNPPMTPLTLSDPREDQLRREMESFAIQDGPETLEHRYKKRRPPLLNLFNSDDEEEDQQSVSTLEPDNSSLFDVSDDRSVRARARRRRKSLLSIFQRRSPVEKLIDMYFNDEPEEKASPPKASNRSRKSSFAREKIPKSPATPPLPSGLHGKQTSL
ncbi:uncharacterized protein Z520_11167 [Fonsecaea multimorphosa CBS 102226]|uniref:Uncharacterized protein n=1 Tax=Fonsecaea multimorphosa CBS 102226 TaxID=1442371 RepID=A0A0D2GUB5_9EURO|nr:uncharacterized protein Z520_11167 [Fonsecaea multimorphosa CBS 102226]KIX93110.1 hypothetical protein Z520_11167 [Fonsecaea multimorphosa CBS 102226]OAL18408.1 hypothetical protein AYO22_10728 [Fonsecaea multimorphosa]